MYVFTLRYMCSWQEKQRLKVKEKLDKCVKEKLVDFCDVLNIPINKASVKKARIYESISIACVGFICSASNLLLWSYVFRRSSQQSY